ncbi:NRDE family protein [Parasphingopyxis sp.]|uniref:NRDE family protein n=1 Tax=Parasphingopyxis sp. TaxID=1920299 RepID=UPI00261A891C|nr:NRDE family protein [Parasphingopyxis sp.]
MCVLAFAWAAHPRWQLVLIGNRDELHARPATPLAHWEDRPGIIAGRDLEAGGTWLGVSQQRRLAVVTNVANPDGPLPDKASRGALIADLLTGAGRYADPAESDLDDFNAFNAIAVEGGTARLFSNRPRPTRRTLKPGIYGLSNSLYAENWPKTDRIKAMLDDWLNFDSGNETGLLDALRADDSPQVEPRRAQQSPIFIRNPVYGTRCSTVVIIDSDGNGRISERRYDPQGKASGVTRIDFRWPSSPPSR